jgi:ribose transport system ATP-binding protein
MKPDASELLNLKGISKRYGGFYAIQDVDLTVRGGEVHVLFGENGAGKSTVIKVISGVTSPDAGEMEIAGLRVTAFSPRQARHLGVSCVFQEFSLAPDLTVEENLFLGREMRKLIFLSTARMRREAAKLLSDLGFSLPLDAKVNCLSRAQQQLVEIAKALLQEVKVLVLDEPTASLTEIETRVLFKLLDALKARGVAIVYVSHRIREIKEIADRITVLRNGRKIATVEASDVDEKQLVELMIGRQLDALFPKIERRPGGIVLKIEGLTTDDRRLRDVSLLVRTGEIVGLAGLVGSGTSDVLRAIYGIDRETTGNVSIGGRTVNAPTPASQLRNGVCYFPSDRVREGLALSRSVQENVTVALLGEQGFAHGGFVRTDRISTASADALTELNVRPADDRVSARVLSGGNRQKVMLARGALRQHHLYLFDDPTAGIDVSAKAQVYRFIGSLVEQGAAVLFVSSELLEMTRLAHRVYVMSEGQIVSELQDDQISEEAILQGFFDRAPPPRSESVQ